MQMQVSAPKLHLNRYLRELVERRLYFALSRFDHRIQRVEVRLRDLPGPRKEPDVHCLIEVTLSPRGKVYVELTDETVEQAVSRAADRAARRVSTELNQKRESHRKVGLGHQPVPVAH